MSNAQPRASTGELPVPPEQVTLAVEGWNATDLESRQIFERSLRSLLGQTYPIRRCQLLVIVDAGVPPEENAWIADLLPEATLLHLPGATYFRSKNLALEQAKGEFLVFADSDVVYEPDWLMHMLSAFREGVDLVVGNTQYPPGPLSRTLNLCDWSATRLTSGYTDWFYGNNLAMRRSLYRRVRFRDDIGRSGGGGANVLREQLLRLGVRPWFCAEARGWHHLAPFWMKRLRIGGYHVHYRRLAPETSWAWVARVPLLGPFLVVGGTLIKAWGRAWRLRSTLPGRGLSLPLYLVSIAVVKQVELLGALAADWVPGWVNRRFGWFDVPQVKGVHEPAGT